MYLVDTNVICEPTRPGPSAPLLAWLSRQPSVKLSAISLIEIEYGIARLPRGSKHDRLTKWFEGVLGSPGIEVVAIDAAITRRAGRLKMQAEAAGRRRPTLDLIIAASAQVTGSVIATRNVGDFEGLGIPLLDPFSG